MAELDSRIEAVLLVRLEAIISLWCSEFLRQEEDLKRDPLRDAVVKRRADRLKDEKVRHLDSIMYATQLNENQHLEGGLALKPIVHEIRIQNQVIFLDPPLEQSRQTWMRQLHEWLGQCELFNDRLCDRLDFLQVLFAYSEESRVHDMRSGFKWTRRRLWTRHTRHS